MQPNRLSLSGGAAIYLRPLTEDLLAESLNRQALALELLLNGDLKTIRELAPISPVFRTVERTAGWVERASELLWPIELMVLSCAALEGVVDETGAKIVQPTRDEIAALLRDPKIFTEVRIAFGADLLKLVANRSGENHA